MNQKTPIGALASYFGRGFILSVLVLAHSMVSDGLGREWTGPDGHILPFESDSEILDFLQTAKVVSKRRVGSGVNNPWKVLLEKDGIRVHACFRDVRIAKRKIHLSKGVKHNFRDDARFEVAAYRLGLLLGIDNIPPVVERRLFETPGTLQLWVENTITEKSRIEQDARPTLIRRVQRWQVQTHTMRAFDTLIYNEDRNQGNILYDRDWNLWMIDHTRAFRRHRQLLTPERVWRFEKGFLSRLRSLDRNQVQNVLSDYLNPAEIRGLIARAAKLVEHADRLVAEKGEERALVDLADLDQTQIAGNSTSIAVPHSIR